jgi:hypothetical protein
MASQDEIVAEDQIERRAHSRSPQARAAPELAARDCTDRVGRRAWLSEVHANRTLRRLQSERLIAYEGR